MSKLFHALGVVVIAAGVPLALWTAVRADRERRQDLLGQARLVAKALSLDDVQALTGTTVDLTSPSYLRLKRQLSALKQANENCRFLYLVGRRAGDAIFFFVDNESPDSPDYSPPGQSYDEASPEFRRTFETRTETTDGPITDRWGTWVTALVPLSDPKSGQVLALLGMDVDARAWRWEVAARAALPAGLILVLLILLATGILAARPGPDASIQVIQRRLMAPLAAMLVVLLSGFGAALVVDQKERLNDSCRQVRKEVSADWARQLARQSRALDALAGLLVQDAGLIEGLREKDRKRLLTAFGSLFARLQAEQGITDFYFSGPDRVCLLRIHKPEEHGDRIDRFTAREAERTGKTASGIELGPPGVFTLRMVRPVYDGAALIGYLEFGKQIEALLADTHRQPGVELAIALRKSALEQAVWEGDGMLPGLRANWGRFAGDVLVYSSLSPFPSEAGRFVGVTAHRHEELTVETEFHGRTWRVMAVPLAEVSGAEVGDLFVLYDVSAQKAAQNRLMTVAAAGGLVLLSGLFGFLFVLLRRTDRSVRAQQANLRESEERLSATLRSIGDAVISTDAEGKVSSLNAVAEQLTGWDTAEANGRPIADILHIVHAQTRDKAENPVTRALSEGFVTGQANHTVLVSRGGAEHHIADSCAPIHGADGEIMGAVLVFRDVSEEYRMRSELREREERFRSLVEGSPNCVTLFDHEGRYLAINQNGLNTMGWIEGDVLGTRFPEVWPADVRPAVEDAVARVLQGEQTSFDANCLRPDGSAVTWWVVLNPIVEDGHGIRRFVGISTDITERKRAENALQAGAKRIRAITESARDAILMMDPAGNISFWNPAAERIFGYTSEEAVGRDLHQLIVPARYHGAFYAGFAKFRETGQGNAWDTILELQACRKDGEEVPVELSLSALPIEDGWHAVGIVRDITERKTAEEKLQEERRKNEAVLFDLFEQAPVAYHELDRDGIVRRVNAAECALLGFQPVEILGRPVWEFATAAEREAVREAVLGELSGQQPLMPFRRRHVRCDGAEVLLEIHDRLVRN